MNKIFALGLASLIPVASYAGLSANIGVTSNYLWRGVSQTGDSAAVSGGIDWNHESGFYLGLWSSNIDWGSGSGAEVDFYGGFSNNIGDFGYDLGLIYYYYPTTGYENSNFTEIYASGSWKIVTIGLNYTVNGQADKDGPFSDGDLYYYINANFNIADTWSLGGTLGYYNFDTTKAWRDKNGKVNYSHGQIDLTKSMDQWGDFTLTISKASKESGNDDVKFIVSWTKTFE